MKVLEVFFLVVLGCSLAEGQLVSKCDLKNQLIKAIDALPPHARPKAMNMNNLVAKIVCHVQLASGFNTSAVIELTLKVEDDDRRRKRDTANGGFLNTIKPHTQDQWHSKQPTPSTHPTPPNHPALSRTELKDPLTTIRHYTRERRNAKQSKPPPNHTTTRAKHPQLEEEVWTLYGLFQLSDHLACNGTSPSPNICEMDCNNLIDNNTSDDISCLLKILTDTVPRAAYKEELNTMVNLIYQKECKNKVASGHFAGCP